MTPRVSIGIVFAVHGAVAGSLATRLPWLEDRFDLGPALLGLVLLCPAAGALLGMPVAARVAHRLGERTATRVLLAAWCAALAPPALAPAAGWLFPAMLLFGATAGMCDVVMNAHGVAVERHARRPIISGLHGLWCVGGLLAGGLGSLAAHAGIDARPHLSAVAAVLLAVGAVAGRGLLPDRPAPAGSAPRRFALPGRAVLALGAVGFCATFAEGASGNWAAVYLTEVAGAGPGLAAAAFTIFASCMAVTRLLGDALVRRLGPVALVRWSGVLAVGGGALVVTARAPVPAIAGFALLGVGVAVAVPLVFAAAGNAGPNAGEGVAGVATINYLSVLAAPAVTGWVAGALSYPAAFAMITCMAAGMPLAAGALRPREEAAHAPAHRGAADAPVGSDR
ncbi:MFS transporter [Spirillospora albida]|uniref:MFS transporter n=1 Tax=Spirillospora albida TaxID=58123 RepID=UPI0004BF3D93|nr:MFS transporter [Spirillospora albida]